MKICTILVGWVLFFGFNGLLPETRLIAAHTTTMVRTSVTGLGTSQMRAETDARNTATAVARGSYRAISVRIVGREGNYTCVMVIEYRQR